MDASKIMSAGNNENAPQGQGLHLHDNSQDATTYVPGKKLSHPRVFPRTLEVLMNALENGKIDIDPEYQREVVWPASRMTGLINSLMENFYIPPIILNKRPDSTLVCVDGKQRLSSVQAFIKGMIPCHDVHGEKWFFCDIPTNQKKKTLPREVQKAFLQKEFFSYEFDKLSPDMEEDLFLRVQMGMQLNHGEKMRASTGPWQELARLFVDDFPAVYALMKDRARAKDFKLTLSCFSQVLEVSHPTTSSGMPPLRTNHSSLPRFLQNKDAVDDGIKSHLARVWKILTNLIEQDSNTFTNANKTLRGVQTFAPIEMVAVTVLISMYAGSKDISTLLKYIGKLRSALRKEFSDLMMNTPVWKFVWDFLDNLDKTRHVVDENVYSGPSRGKAPSTIGLGTSSRYSGPPVPPVIKKEQISPKKRTHEEGMEETLTDEEFWDFVLNNASDLSQSKRQRTSIASQQAESSGNAAEGRSKASRVVYPDLVTGPQSPYAQFPQGVSKEAAASSSTKSQKNQSSAGNQRTPKTDGIEVTPKVGSFVDKGTEDSYGSSFSLPSTSFEAQRQRLSLLTAYSHRGAMSPMGLRPLHSQPSQSTQTTVPLPELGGSVHGSPVRGTPVRGSPVHAGRVRASARGAPRSGRARGGSRGSRGFAVPAQAAPVRFDPVRVDYGGPTGDDEVIDLTRDEVIDLTSE